MNGGSTAEASARALDAAIARLMAGKPGAVVLLDVASGKIIAQSNLKTAAQRVTAPGSTLKPFVLLELLQSGKLDPEQRLVCRRKLTIAGRNMDCCRRYCLLLQFVFRGGRLAAGAGAVGGGAGARRVRLAD